MSKLIKIEGGRPGEFVFQCPGCGVGHSVLTDTSQKPCWQFNGSFKRPTFSPSILVEGHYTRDEDGTLTHEVVICHSFVRDGKIEFLWDCTHKLAGKTVDMEDV
jgi:hypothetical protein